MRVFGHEYPSQEEDAESRKRGYLIINNFIEALNTITVKDDNGLDISGKSPEATVLKQLIRDLVKVSQLAHPDDKTDQFMLSLGNDVIEFFNKIKTSPQAWLLYTNLGGRAK